MPDWKEELGNQFDEALSSAAPKPKKVSKIKKKTVTETTVDNTLTTQMEDGTMNLPIFLVICIMTITLIASYNWKNFGSIYAHSSKPTSGYQQYQTMQQQYQRDAFDQQDRQWDQYRQAEDVRRRDYEDQAEDAIRKTYGRTKTNRERITLLGILYNNNTAAAAAGSRDFIYLNEDWTINRMPNHLALDSGDREFLGRYVKK